MGGPPPIMPLAPSPGGDEKMDEDEDADDEDVAAAVDGSTCKKKKY